MIKVILYCSTNDGSNNLRGETESTNFHELKNGELNTILYLRPYLLQLLLDPSFGNAIRFPTARSF